jgi:predicted phosphatase
MSHLHTSQPPFGTPFHRLKLNAHFAESRNIDGRKRQSITSRICHFIDDAIEVFHVLIVVVNVKLVTFVAAISLTREVCSAVRSENLRFFGGPMVVVRKATDP